MQNAGLSGRDNQSKPPASGDGQPAQPGQPGQDGGSGTNKLGMPNQERADIPKDGVIRDRQDAQGMDMTPSDMQKNKAMTGPAPDGGTPSDDSVKPAPAQDAPPGDRTLSSSQDGKVNDVSNYNAKDNKLTDYKLNDQGDVASRTTTDLNNNSVDTTQYGADGRQTGHQVAADGQAPQDAPLDSKEQVMATKGQNGQVNAIETTNGDSSSKISLDGSGKPSSIDSEQTAGDLSSTRTHQDLDQSGRTTSTETKSYDSDGRLRTAETAGAGATDKKTYDDNRRVTSDESHTEFGDNKTVNTPDGSATASRSVNGAVSAEIKGKDGSSYSSDYNATFQSSKTTETAPDGSTHTTTEDPANKTDSFKDKSSGIWGNETTDKRTGAIHKKTGGPGMETQSWTEQHI